MRLIGVGSGSTIVYAVEQLGIMYKSGYPITACIPSSFQAQELILSHKLPLGSLNEYPLLDITFDGADEVDFGLNLIKGGGACHLQEKLLISNSKQVFIVADYRKRSEFLGTNWTRGIPLEVIPSGYKSVMLRLEKLGTPQLRMGVNKAGPVVTDNGNFVVDLLTEFKGGSKSEGKSEGSTTTFTTLYLSFLHSLQHSLESIPGIVETGLFLNMADGCYFGLEDGTVQFKASEKALALQKSE